MNKITFWALILFFQTAYAQQFSGDIVVDSAAPGLQAKLFANISLDSQNHLGISWTDRFSSRQTVNYIRSTDGGNTFINKRVIAEVPLNSQYGSLGIRSIHFDGQDNPIALYYWEDFFLLASEHFLKKSSDGGNTFLDPTFDTFSDTESSGCLWNNDNTGFIAIDEFGTQGLTKVYKTYDNGFTFPDTGLIDREGLNLLRVISILQLDNGELLCFWEGFDQINLVVVACYNRSTDGGQTFGPKINFAPETLSPNGIIATAYQNYVFAVYLAQSDSMAVQIALKKSEDYGYTFSEKKVLYDFNGGVPSHPFPSVQFNPYAGVCVIWSIPLTGGIRFTRSRDFGETFDSTVVVTQGGNYRNANSLVVSDSGDVYAVSYKTAEKNLVLNRTKLEPIVSVNPPGTAPVSVFQLSSNYPNPFNGETFIRFRLPISMEIRLEVFDLSGRLIRILAQGRIAAGFHLVRWNGLDRADRQAASGVYFYRLKSQNFQQVKKMILLR